MSKDPWLKAVEDERGRKVQSGKIAFILSPFSSLLPCLMKLLPREVLGFTREAVGGGKMTKRGGVFLAPPLNCSDGTSVSKPVKQGSSRGFQ